MNEATKNLYSCLRKIKNKGYKSIAVEKIPNPSISINLNTDKNYIFIEIIDNGIGISKEKVVKIFEPYFTTKKSGHGIGMMIVHRIMRDHGGEVGIDSKEGSGTIVTLNFPRKSIQRTLLESSNP